MTSPAIAGTAWALRRVASSSRTLASAPSSSLARHSSRSSDTHRIPRRTYVKLCNVASTDVFSDGAQIRARRRISTDVTPLQRRSDLEKPPLPPTQQTPYERLSPVLQALPGPIDWGVAYGSGVITQANAPSSAVPPLTDFLVSTSDPARFHEENIRKHPSHYPSYARWMGGTGIARMQENWGAGVWYVTNVHLCGLEVKYGVISTSRLKRDLEEWETLYVAGRLHKPVLPLRIPRSLESSLTQNLRSALYLALLQLPETFTEMELWEEIAGISYSGDPRMSVPGAENPQKVKNIVRGPGVREGFREMYGGLLVDIRGVQWESSSGDKEPGKWEWRGEGSDVLSQPSSSAHRAALFSALPRHLQSSISLQLKSDHENVTSLVEDARFRKTLQEEVGKIIRRPALTQSFKGLVTAGPIKSFFYGLAKVRKWWAGRRKS